MHVGVLVSLYVMCTKQVSFHLMHSDIDYFVLGKHALLCISYGNNPCLKFYSVYTQNYPSSTIQTFAA